jgi:hypothetical protein
MEYIMTANHQLKYNEKEISDTVLNYISSTYNAHYTSEESDIQVIDLIHANGDSVAFCRSSAIKYLSRFMKKKSTTPKSDLLKAIHFCYLLYHFSGCDKPVVENINNAV